MVAHIWNGCTRRRRQANQLALATGMLQASLGYKKHETLSQKQKKASTMEEEMKQPITEWNNQ